MNNKPDNLLIEIFEKNLKELSINNSHLLSEKAISEEIVLTLTKSLEELRQLNRENNDSTGFEHMVGQNKNYSLPKKTHKFLSNKLENCYALTVCDPFILSYNKEHSSTDLEEEADNFISLFPNSLQSLTLYISPKKHHYNSTFSSIIKDKLDKRKIDFIEKKTNAIHDRVWITNNSNAFVVGTSFNGLGKKCAFIIDLPPEDTSEFIEFLKRI